MELSQILRERYAVRKYADTPVTPEQLQAVLEAGQLAPTAKNIQPWRVYVLKSPEAIAKIRALSPSAYNAPVVLLFTYDRQAEWQNPFDPSFRAGQEDCSIAATCMMLRAADLSLGTCWVNFFDPAKLKEAFALPEQEQPLLLLPLGVPAPDSAPAALHFQRKSLEELSSEL